MPDAAVMIFPSRVATAAFAVQATRHHNGIGAHNWPSRVATSMCGLCMPSSTSGVVSKHASPASTSRCKMTSMVSPLPTCGVKAAVKAVAMPLNAPHTGCTHFFLHMDTPVTTVSYHCCIALDVSTAVHHTGTSDAIQRSIHVRMSVLKMAVVFPRIITTGPFNLGSTAAVSMPTTQVSSFTWCRTTRTRGTRSCCPSPVAPIPIPILHCFTACANQEDRASYSSSILTMTTVTTTPPPFCTFCMYKTGLESALGHFVTSCADALQSRSVCDTCGLLGHIAPVCDAASGNEAGWFDGMNEYARPAAPCPPPLPAPPVLPPPLLTQPTQPTQPTMAAFAEGATIKRRRRRHRRSSVVGLN